MSLLLNLDPPATFLITDDARPRRPDPPIAAPPADLTRVSRMFSMSPCLNALSGKKEKCRCICEYGNIRKPTVQIGKVGDVACTECICLNGKQDDKYGKQKKGVRKTRRECHV